MIHPQAIVDPSAKIADDVSIGPFTVIGADVQIDSGTTVASHVVINGPKKIGKDNLNIYVSIEGKEVLFSYQTKNKND
ncbi:MAG: hypothetical protein L3J46_07890 [Kangiellaceae bacterium]|nr:hypothetical protein [Kangiellaceae bacterium]